MAVFKNLSKRIYTTTYFKYNARKYIRELHCDFFSLAKVNIFSDFPYIYGERYGGRFDFGKRVYNDTPVLSSLNTYYKPFSKNAEHV